MPKDSNTGNLPQLLFRFKSGTVTAEVHGPRLGWQSRYISYFRWVKDTKEPTKWNKILPNREVDQIHLEKCVKAVRRWLREQEQ